MMLRDLKERRVIEDSQSPWASPIVLVAKKDGTIRLCVDVRERKTRELPLTALLSMALQNLQGARGPPARLYLARTWLVATGSRLRRAEPN
ncbi:hypothetical protein OSTOST_03926 [Ostertagia ostertagi]